MYRLLKLSKYLKLTSQVVSNKLKTRSPAVIIKGRITITQQMILTHSAARTKLPTGNVSITSGPATTTQVRFLQRDINGPDWTKNRRAGCKSPTEKTSESEDSEKNFNYLTAIAAIISGAYAAKSLIQHFVEFTNEAADVLALAKIEIKLGQIPEENSMTFKWRGKPLFISHRTAEEIAIEQSVPVSSIRDPQQDSDCVKISDWLIVMDICTHLGCVPIANLGDFGEYYCPCHVSH